MMCFFFAGAIYEDLLCFSTPLGDSTDTVITGKSKRPVLVRQSSVCLSPKKGIPSSEKEPPRDPHTGKGTKFKRFHECSLLILIS